MSNILIYLCWAGTLCMVIVIYWHIFIIGISLLIREYRNLRKLIKEDP